jgi:beta-xylosidase
VDADLLKARNTLTQRTFGPECSGTTAIDVANMQDGDFAGLALLQKHYGLVGVKLDGGSHSIVMVSAKSGPPTEMQAVPLTQKTVFLKAECNFNDRVDTVRFFYSLDGKIWMSIGSELKMAYTLPHFMGYRFSLFNYATKAAGGFVDFDCFRVSDQITATK